jgi:hypothetical protein
MKSTDSFRLKAAIPVQVSDQIWIGKHTIQTREVDHEGSGGVIENIKVSQRKQSLKSGLFTKMQPRNAKRR